MYAMRCVIARGRATHLLRTQRSAIFYAPRSAGCERVSCAYAALCVSYDNHDHGGLTREFGGETRVASFSYTSDVSVFLLSVCLCSGPRVWGGVGKGTGM